MNHWIALNYITLDDLSGKSFGDVMTFLSERYGDSIAYAKGQGIDLAGKKISTRVQTINDYNCGRFEALSLGFEVETETDSSKVLDRTFAVTGKLRITDPGFSKDSSSQVVIDALPGTWIYSVQMFDGCVSILKARHTDCSPFDISDLANFTNAYLGSVGVDSGSVGIFNDDVYPDAGSEYRDSGRWFSEWSYESISVHGLIPNVGVVTSAGYGDGRYPVYIAKDAKKGNKAVGISIVFIDEEEE